MLKLFSFALQIYIVSWKLEGDNTRIYRDFYCPINDTVIHSEFRETLNIQSKVDDNDSSCYRGIRDTLFAYTLDVYRRANLRSGLDTSLPSRVYRLAKVFPKKRRGDEREREKERFTRFRSRKKAEERERREALFCLREETRFEETGLSSVCLLETYPLLTLPRILPRDLPPCRIFSLSGPSFHSLRSGIYEIRRPICQSFMCQNTLSYWRRVYDVCYDVAFIPIPPAFPLSKRREKGCI